MARLYLAVPGRSETPDAHLRTGVGVMIPQHVTIIRRSFANYPEGKRDSGLDFPTKFGGETEDDASLDSGCDLAVRSSAASASHTL